MKAVLCTEHGPPEKLSVVDIPAPVAGPGQVVVSMRAASLNFPDLLIIQDKYQVKPPLPFSPGAESAGVISAIGPGVTGHQVGDPVIALTSYGAYAEEVLVPAARLMPMPRGMDFTTAAAFGLTYGTSAHALVDRGALREGETLLVLGAAGGVGLAAVEIGKALGARVIACASSAARLAICREHGADDGIDYAHEDLREQIRALTDQRGPDVIYDPVGDRYSEPALRSIAWRGRHLVVGFAAGDVPKMPLNLALLKGASIVGVFFGDFLRREPSACRELWQQLCAWYEAGRLRPHVSMVLPLAQAADGLRALGSRAVAGKIVLTR